MASLVLTAAIVGFLIWRSNKGAREDAGSPRGSWWVDTPQGPVVVVGDNVRIGRSERGRLLAVDPKTGQRLATRVFDHGGVMCTTAGAARLWCQREELDLLDARTLASVGGETLRREHLATASHGLGITADAAWIVRDDGRIARVDATTLAVTEAREMPATSERPTDTMSCAQPTEATVANASLAFGPGPRRALSINGKPSSTTMLEPRFVVGANREPLVVSGAVFVDHPASLESTAHHQLSRVDATGQVTWTTDIVGGCELAVLQGDTLVVTSKSGARRARGVDVATGAVRWQLTFD